MSLSVSPIITRSFEKEWATRISNSMLVRLSYASLAAAYFSSLNPGAGSFFQNNNSVLVALANYVKSHIPRPVEGSSQYLIDAYCGSGLFSIMLADRFTEVAGVEISADSVKYAEHNAQLNNISNAKFIVGNAEAIFEVRVTLALLVVSFRLNSRAGG
jgi:tRNA/tmRNA/rRNA uracil-C5-methylase (TrmA/RlmC/RlmD family)